MSARTFVVGGFVVVLDASQSTDASDAPLDEAVRLAGLGLDLRAHSKSLDPDDGTSLASSCLNAAVSASSSGD